MLLLFLLFVIVFTPVLSAFVVVDEIHITVITSIIVAIFAVVIVVDFIVFVIAVLDVV